MISISRLTFVAMSMAGLAACGTSEAIFVTTTTIGINAETTPPNLTFAYDRYEGFFGPADQDGNMPPVVARIESNHSIRNPKVKQLYATGAAAIDVTIDGKAEDAEGNILIEKRRDHVAQMPNGERINVDDPRVAFFGVAQTTGLKVTFGPTNVVDSVSVGYKRKEASYLPLVEKETEDEGNNKINVATYPSTLAALSRNAEISGISETSDGVTQFFATGNAARNLALSEPVRNLFKRNAQAALKRATDADEEFVNLYDTDAAYKAAVDAWVDTRSAELAGSSDAAERSLGTTCKSVSRIFGLTACSPLRAEIQSIYPGVGG